MRHIIIRMLAATALATIFMACSSGDEKAVAFKTATTEKSIPISKEQGAPSCNVSLQMFYADGNGEPSKLMNSTIAERLLDISSADMKLAMDSFATKYTQDYVSNFAPLYREDCDDATKRAWYEYHYNITTETAEGRDGVTIYRATIDYYEGGAHGINQCIVMNFENMTGKLLTLQDVFVPGYASQLNDILLKKLMEVAEAKNVDELRQKGYLYSMDMFAPENFELGDDEVRFIYNPYEIAPYDKGMTELVVGNDELEGLWK